VAAVARRFATNCTCRLRLGTRRGARLDSSLRAAAAGAVARGISYAMEQTIVRERVATRPLVHRGTGLVVRCTNAVLDPEPWAAGRRVAPSVCELGEFVDLGALPRVDEPINVGPVFVGFEGRRVLTGAVGVRERCQRR
jgi:hypothetical protein